MDHAIAQNRLWLLVRVLCFAVVTIAFVVLTPDTPILFTVLSTIAWIMISVCILGGTRVTSTLIPYRNAPALGAYYCAVLSLCPILGLPFSLAAIALGVRGLRLRREQPESKGRVHAWIGIIGGALTVLLSSVFFVYLLIASLS